LAEAASSSFSDPLQAVDVALQSGASVVSMSWGGGEFSTESAPVHPVGRALRNRECHAAGWKQITAGQHKRHK